MPKDKSLYYHLVVYVPESDLDQVKTALFKAGAGQLGNYSHCAWQTLGQGQFLPGDQSQPAIGKHGAVSVVPEYRLEMLCPSTHYPSVIDALRVAHPYEEPAFLVYKLIEPMNEHP